MGFRGPRRESGESMRVWTFRFEGFIKRTGNAHYQADANMDAKIFLHPLILGVVLLECSQIKRGRKLRYWRHLQQHQGVEHDRQQSLVQRCGCQCRCQWDDEAIHIQDKSSHRRAGHLSATASSREPLCLEILHLYMCRLFSFFAKCFLRTTFANHIVKVL